MPDMTIYTSGGILYVISSANTLIKIVRPDGVIIYKDIKEGMNVIDDLNRGFYIVEHRKVIL